MCCDFSMRQSHVNMPIFCCLHCVVLSCEELYILLESFIEFYSHYIGKYMGTISWGPRYLQLSLFHSPQALAGISSASVIFIIVVLSFLNRVQSRGLPKKINTQQQMIMCLTSHFNDSYHSHSKLWLCALFKLLNSCMVHTSM